MDHYERLGLTREADARDVARAFRRAARDEHPDRGGDAERFRALEEAYRVLISPDRRRAYDGELDGATPSWDDVAWGAEVVPPGHPGPTPGEAAPDGPPDDSRGDGWDDDPRWGEDPSVDARHGPGADGPGGSRRLDAFVGGPVRLPDPLAPVAKAPQLGAGRREVVAALVAAALAAVAVAARLIALQGAPGRGAASVDEASLELPSAAVMVLALGLVLHVASLRAPAGEPFAWLATTGSALLWFAEVDVPEATGVMWVSLVTGPGAVVPAVVWARRYRDRTRDPAYAAALNRESLGWRIDRHHRAEEWNRVRAALQVPGRVVVAVGPHATDRAGRPLRGRCWTFDPRTGAEAVRPVGEASPKGSWVVVDPYDRVVATAPAWSPEAWLDILQEG